MSHIALTLLLMSILTEPGSKPASTLHIKVGMRDGERLCTNVFRPSPTGQFPVVLLRTAYRKPDQLTPSLRQFVEAGYALVVQDVRGRYHSGGEFEPFLHEEEDGEDTLTWITRQTWSDDRIGMFGGSYSGISQWRVALSRHPALRAIIPVVSGGDEYLDRYYSRGGAFKLGHRLLWIAENFKPLSWPRPDFEKIKRHVPLRTADRAFTRKTLGFYQSALDHPAYDGYWASLSTRRQVDRVNVPVLIISGWYDNYAESDLGMFSALRDLGNKVRMIIGPWGHNLSSRMPNADFGPEADPPRRVAEIAWFDAHIRHTAPAPASGVRYFVMGANAWRESPDWPPKGRRQLLYLGSRSGANSLSGDGRLLLVVPRRSKPDEFEYDPRNPVPTLGGALCCNARLFPWGPLDQRPAEQRRDVLVYTSETLTTDIEVAGAVEVVLFVSSSAPDTDFTAKLVDVAPDGMARIICDGVLRMRFRGGVDRPLVYRPGTVEKIVVETGVTANVFRAGHRIRVDVASSNYPRFDRNPNTGRPVAAETVFRVASQKVHHDSAHPSHVSLPVSVAGSRNRPLP